MKNIFKQAHISQETLLQSEVKHFSNGSDICYSAYFRSYYIDEEVEFKICALHVCTYFPSTTPSFYKSGILTVTGLGNVWKLNLEKEVIMHISPCELILHFFLSKIVYLYL